MKTLLAPLLLLALLLPTAAAATTPELGARPIYEQPRNPGVAGMLSFFVPGGGHFYCGHKRTGAIYLGSSLGLVAAAGVVALTAEDDHHLEALGPLSLLGVAFLGLKVVDIGHAMHTAREINLGLAAGPRGQPGLMLSANF